MNKPTEIMTKKFNPRDLAKEQAEAYKKYIIDVLDEVRKCVKDGNFSKIDKMLFNSPAGDGWGMDNKVIDFGYDKTPMDISEALNYLAFLKLYSYGEIDVDETFCDGIDYLDRL